MHVGAPENAYSWSMDSAAPSPSEPDWSYYDTVSYPPVYSRNYYFFFLEERSTEKYIHLSLIDMTHPQPTYS